MKPRTAVPTRAVATAARALTLTLGLLVATEAAASAPPDAATREPAWLANNLNERGQALRAGEFVMTGSSIVTQFPDAGDELLFTIDGLGEARLTCG